MTRSVSEKKEKEVSKLSPIDRIYFSVYFLYFESELKEGYTKIINH